VRLLDMTDDEFFAAQKEEDRAQDPDLDLDLLDEKHWKVTVEPPLESAKFGAIHHTIPQFAFDPLPTKIIRAEELITDLHKMGYWAKREAWVGLIAVYLENAYRDGYDAGRESWKPRSTRVKQQHKKKRKGER
jgi:hypothetical protein